MKAVSDMFAPCVNVNTTAIAVSAWPCPATTRQSSPLPRRGIAEDFAVRQGRGKPVVQANASPMPPIAVEKSVVVCAKSARQGPDRKE